MPKFDISTNKEFSVPSVSCLLKDPKTGHRRGIILANAEGIEHLAQVNEAGEAGILSQAEAKKILKELGGRIEKDGELFLLRVEEIPGDESGRLKATRVWNGRGYVFDIQGRHHEGNIEESEVAKIGFTIKKTLNLRKPQSLSCTYDTGNEGWSFHGHTGQCFQMNNLKEFLEELESWEPLLSKLDNPAMQKALADQRSQKDPATPEGYIPFVPKSMNSALAIMGKTNLVS